MDKKLEKESLVLSAAAAFAFALLGLIVGVWSNSVVILFDSAYSLLSLMLALLSLYALKQANKPADQDYPFGRITIEPVAVLVKGLVIGIVCVGSIAISVITILQGGQTVELDIALFFAVINSLGCAILWLLLHRAHKKSTLPLLEAEVKQWQMDTWLSLSVLIGFCFVYFLQLTPWSKFIRFADPLMVIVIASYFMKIPVRMVRNALREIMFASPNHIGSHQLLGALNDKDFRIAKVGSNLILQITTSRHSAEELIISAVSRYSTAENLRLIVIRPIN